MYNIYKYIYINILAFIILWRLMIVEQVPTVLIFN